MVCFGSILIIHEAMYSRGAMESKIQVKNDFSSINCVNKEEFLDHTRYVFKLWLKTSTAFSDAS